MTETAEPLPTPTSQRTSRFVWWTAALFVLYVLFRLAAPHVRGLPPLPASLAATILFLVLSLGIVVSATGIVAPWQGEAGAFLAGVALWFVAGARHDPLLSDCALILSAIALGRLVSRAVRYPNLLVPIGAVAAFVDIWGVNLGGPVAQVVQKAPETAARFVTHVPSFGAPHFVAIVGVGDFVFLAVFFACLRRFQLNVTGAATLAAVFAVVGLVVAVRLIPLPGLPFIAAGVLLPNARRFHFTREEKFALVYGAIFLVALLAAGTVLMRRAVPPPAGKQGSVPTQHQP